jgi:hypothetical protein
MNMTIHRIGPDPIKADVEKLMKIYGVRQLDIAAKLGISASNFSAMLNGYQPITDQVLLGVRRLKQAEANRAEGGASQADNTQAQALV